MTGFQLTPVACFQLVEVGEPLTEHHILTHKQFFSNTINITFISPPCNSAGSWQVLFTFLHTYRTHSRESSLPTKHRKHLHITAYSTRHETLHQPLQAYQKSLNSRVRPVWNQTQKRTPKEKQLKPLNEMSGSGGYYKYRCKYFLTAYCCTNWVYVAHAPCANCLVSLVVFRSMIKFLVLYLHVTITGRGKNLSMQHWPQAIVHT